ncbi:hypothetical protein H6B51_10425 [Pseudoflavonifractor phocaeensis]|nr:hypothetical protein [Pseudoflavonifractor phocaeensis]
MKAQSSPFWPAWRDEVVARFCNACAGSSRPQTFFEEVELARTDEFVRAKHGKDFDKFSKEMFSDGRILYRYDNGSVTYSYELTEI